MELIKSSEISARIYTLLDESYEQVILVSPYMKISKWYKLLRKLDEVKSRGVLPEIYVRDDPDNIATYSDLDQLVLPYKKIPHLHSKLYMNEQQGIVTSMNLLLSSEINSLEIGYATENWAEYNELSAYYFRNFQKGEIIYPEPRTSLHDSNLNLFIKTIKEELLITCRNSWFLIEGIALHISTGGNNFRLQIIDGKLNITTKLRSASRSKKGTLLPFSSITEKISDLTNMKVGARTNLRSDGILLIGMSRDKLQSTCITGLLQSETECLTESVVRFIDAIHQLS
jgi:hypothetical protein